MHKCKNILWCTVLHTPPPPHARTCTKMSITWHLLIRWSHTSSSTQTRHVCNQKRGLVFIIGLTSLLKFLLQLHRPTRHSLTSLYLHDYFTITFLNSNKTDATMDTITTSALYYNNNNNNYYYNYCNKYCYYFLIKIYNRTTHVRVGKVIYWELSKKLKFGHADECYRQKPESILVNETHKIFWDFEIQTDCPIPARGSNIGLINQKKKNLLSGRFFPSSRP